MFKWIWPIAVLCIAVSAKEKVVLTYSTNPAYPPYDWANTVESFDGASIDLLKMVVPPDVTLVPIVMPWKRAMSMAKEGQIDLLVSLRINPERKEYLRFTDSKAFANPIVVFVRADKSFPFHKWSDLKGKLGGVSLGDTFGAGFDEYWKKELKVEEAPTMDNNFSKLANGYIDYFVTSLYVGQAYVASHPEAKSIVALPMPISSLDIHFGFSKQYKNDTLIQYVNRKLAELEKTNVSDQLLQKALQRYKAKPDMVEIK